MGVLFACKSVEYVYQDQKEGLRSPGTGITDDCVLPCGCCGSNPGPPEEQSGLLTTKPYIQPQHQVSVGKTKTNSWY